MDYLDLRRKISFILMQTHPDYLNKFAEILVSWSAK